MHTCSGDFEPLSLAGGVFSLCHILFDLPEEKAFRRSLANGFRRDESNIRGDWEAMGEDGWAALDSLRPTRSHLSHHGS